MFTAPMPFKPFFFAVVAGSIFVYFTIGNSLATVFGDAPRMRGGRGIIYIILFSLLDVGIVTGMIAVFLKFELNDPLVLCGLIGTGLTVANYLFIRKQGAPLRRLVRFCIYGYDIPMVFLPAILGELLSWY